LGDIVALTKVILAQFVNTLNGEFLFGGMINGNRFGDFIIEWKMFLLGGTEVL